MLLNRLSLCVEPFYWLSDFAARKRVMRGTRQQLEASQRRRFRRLVRMVSRRSPFYRDLMQKRRLDPETCELHQFPVLTRQQLIERFGDIVTDRCLTGTRLDRYLSQGPSPTELFEGRYHIVHSSGTTGRRVFMAYSPREWIRGVSHYVRYASGLRWRKRCAFVGLINTLFTGYSVAMAGQRGINSLFYNNRCFDLSQPLCELVAGLNEFQPQMLSAYASGLSSLAEEQRSGRLSIRPQCLISSGDALSMEQRRLIEETFGQPVKNLYAATETLLAGVSDSPGDSMLLFEDDLIFEPQEDHYLVTSLFHTTTPLIRYRMEDAIQFVAEQETRPLRTARHFVGRSTTSLRFRNNHGVDENFPPLLLLALETRGVTQFQLVYEGVDGFRFRVRLDSTLSTDESTVAVKHVQEWLRQKLIEQNLERSVAFTVEAVEDIPPDPRTGKVQLIQRTDDIKHAA